MLKNSTVTQTHSQVLRFEGQEYILGGNIFVLIIRLIHFSGHKKFGGHCSQINPVSTGLQEPIMPVKAHVRLTSHPVVFGGAMKSVEVLPFENDLERFTCSKLRRSSVSRRTFSPS